MEELTRPTVLPYPVEGATMDEQVDVKNQSSQPAEVKEENKGEKEARNSEVLRLRREKAKKAWEEENKKREAKGEKITEREKEAQKNLIERGMGPIVGGASDGYFEHFPVKKFENTQLKDFAQELKDLGKNSQVTEEKLQQITQSVRDMIGLGVVPEQTGNDFIEEISKVRTARDTGSTYEGERESETDGEEAKGDGSFENFNAYLFFNTNLESLASEIVEAGKKNQISSQLMNSWAQRAQEMFQKGEITQDQYQAFATELNNTAREYNAHHGAKGNEQNEAMGERLKSIQEVCRWIIDKEGDEYAAGGVNELLDKEGNFNKANFVKWVRERMLHFHNLDPNNPSINLLGSIGVETTYRTIGLITMINNKKQYFKDDKRVDENGRNVVYSELADDIINEVYLFNTSRNHDANYRFGMWNDEKLPELLGQLHQKSDFTNADQLKKIMSFSSEYGTGDTKVGDTIRKAYEVYFYMSDYEKLQEVLGADSQFFTRQGFEDALRLMQNWNADEPIPENYAKLFDTLFDSSGKPKVKDFISYINLFNETGKQQSTIGLVREAVRLGVSKLYGLDNGLKYTGGERSVSRKNLEYAEMWAYSMARWTGAAARNDTGAIGYDAQTKTQRFQQYRIRQAKAERGGAFGNEYDLPVIKDLTLDFFNGIFIEKGVGESRDFTPFEIFQQLDAVDVRKDIDEEEKRKLKEPIFNRLKFKQFTQLDYASNHLGRAYQVFHWIMGANELNLDQIVKHEPFRGLVFDRAKFEEQVKENFLKPIRYAFSTYSNIDYSKKVRVEDAKASREQERPVYKEVTMAEAMFGPSVLQDFYKKDEKGNRVIDEAMLRDKRGLLYKRVARSILAAHIRSHRELFSGYAKLDYAQMEKFYEALESIREIELSEGESDMDIAATKSFFTKDDIKWMRKYSKTEKGRMLMIDVGPSVAAGAFGGLFKGGKAFFEDIFK